MCSPHNWVETGKRAHHVEGNIFKYGTPVVTYVKCEKCSQMGYRKPGKRLVFTWANDG